MTEITDHREMLIETMARTMFEQPALGGSTGAEWGPCTTKSEWRRDARAALDALTTGPVLEKMVEEALRAHNATRWPSSPMSAALRAALGAGQPPADQH